MIKRNWKFIVIILLIVGAGVYYYKAKNKEETVARESLTPQMVYEVTKGSLQKTITTEGYITPVKEQDLTFPAKSSGSVKITGIYVKEGDRVEKGDRKSTRLNSSHVRISYAVFCLKKKKKK